MISHLHLSCIKERTNSISHDILLKKIEAYGFSESAVDLFASFLKNRQQCVKINDV